MRKKKKKNVKLQLLLAFIYNNRKRSLDVLKRTTKQKWIIIKTAFEQHKQTAKTLSVITKYNKKKCIEEKTNLFVFYWREDKRLLRNDS